MIAEAVVASGSCTHFNKIRVVINDCQIILSIYSEQIGGHSTPWSVSGWPSCKTVVEIISIKIDLTLLCKMVNVQDCLWQKRKSNASFISKRFAYQIYSSLFEESPD